MIGRAAVVVAIAAAVLAAAGCTSFDYTRCGDRICAADLACCGSACVPATCGDGEVQPAEQCDTWTLRACTDTGFDFGQRGCTATCQLDDAPCRRFGFHGGGLPCDLPKPSQLGVVGDTLWVGTRLKLAVAVGAGGCRTATLATAPSRLLAVSADEAIAVLNPAALQAVTPAGVVDVPFTLPPVQSAVVVDERTVVLGHSGGVLTLVERGVAGWAARAVTLGCPATGLRRIDAVARHGDQLVVVFFATVPQLGTVPLAALAAPAVAATATCRDLIGVPPATDWNAAHAGADGLYFVGNATAPDLTVTSVVVRARPQPDGSVATTILRGTQPVDVPSAHLAPLAPAVRSWLDPAGALHLAGGTDALVLRDDRWRRLDEPIDRDFGATVAYRDLTVTTTLSSALTSRGHGYEVIDDLTAAAHPARCAATATSCTIGAAGRARGAAWMLVTSVDTTTTRAIVRDGAPIARDLAGAAWLPLALAFGGDTEWIVARPTGRLELYLWRSADDPAPTRIAASCTVAVLDLDVGPTMAAAATRLGRVDDLACPRTHEVVRRRLADDVVETLWSSPDEIRQLAVPADGADVVLALVTTRDEGGVVTAVRVVEVRPDGTAHDRATLVGGHDVRAMWAADRDHAWLVGDRGLLLRFSGDALVDRSGDLGQIAGATLRAVAGTGPADVFLAGDDNTLFHFDGHAWTPVSPSSQIESFTTLALGPDDVWLGAGDRALALRVPRTPPVAPSCPAP